MESRKMGLNPQMPVEWHPLFTSEHLLPAANITSRTRLSKLKRRKSLSLDVDGSTIAIFLVECCCPAATAIRMR